MKYCVKCGQQMDDEALFCPRCGTKAASINQQENPVVEETQEVEKQEGIEETAQVKEEQNKNAKVKTARKATPLHEQKVKEFLPVAIAAIVCSIAMWILQATLSPTGIFKVMPLLIFALLDTLFGVLNLVRAIQCLNRKNFFIAALSFVLATLLFICSIVNLIFLMS